MPLSRKASNLIFEILTAWEEGFKEIHPYKNFIFRTQHSANLYTSQKSVCNEKTKSKIGILCTISYQIFEKYFLFNIDENHVFMIIDSELIFKEIDVDGVFIFKNTERDKLINGNLRTPFCISKGGKSHVYVWIDGTYENLEKFNAKCP